MPRTIGQMMMNEPTPAATSFHGGNSGSEARAHTTMAMLIAAEMTTPNRFAMWALT